MNDSAQGPVGDTIAPHPATQFSGLWRGGEPPDLAGFLARLGPLPEADLVAVLLVDQRRRWEVGRPLGCEDYLERFPLPAGGEPRMELVYGEIALRQERGEAVELAEYQRRFPDLAERLKVQFEVRQALSSLMPTTTAGWARPVPVGVPGTDDPFPSVPGFEIVRLLGVGGMGVVYLARQPSLDRLVALKMIRADNAAPAFRERFLAEAAVIARLRHPGIVVIHELGEHDGQPFFALEYCPHGSLAARLGGKPQDPLTAAGLVRRLAEAVEAAHRAGVVHRDLKPGNVLLTDGEGPEPSPKITDFGLARRIDLPGSNEATAVVGTAPYLPPEQARGEAPTPAADVYALGAVLYEMLTGRPPFLGASFAATLEQVLAGDPVPPRRLQPGTPADLDTICLKCLRYQPAERYASAQEAAEDLGRFLRHEPIRARPVGRLERLRKWARRRPAVAGLSAALLLVALVGFAGVVWKWRGERGQRLRAEAAEGVALEKAAAESEQRERAQTFLAFNSVALAQREWLAGNLPRAVEALDDCPPDRRDWEWRHLRRLCQGGERSVHLGEGAVFSADGRFAAWTEKDKTVVHDLDTGKQLFRAIGTPLTLTSSGRLLTTLGNQLGVFRWSKDGKVGDPQVLKPDPNAVWSNKGYRHAAFSEDGRLMVTSAGAGTALPLPDKGGAVKIERSPARTILWDLETGKARFTLPDTAGEAACLALSPDGSRLATACDDRPGEVRVWDGASEKPLAILGASRQPICCLAFDSKGKRLAASDEAGVIHVWDDLAGRPMALRGHQGPVRALAFSAGGQRLASGGSDRLVRVWDLRRGHQAFVQRGHGLEVERLAFRASDRELLAADGRVAHVWPAGHGPATRRLEGAPEAVRGVAFRPDGRQIAAGLADGRVQVWGWPDGRPARVLGKPQMGRPLGDFSCLAFSPDSRLVTVMQSPRKGDGSGVAVHDADTGEAKHEVWPRQLLPAVAFAPAGWLATAGWDGTVKRWEGGHEINAHQVPKMPCLGVAVSSDGEHVLVTGCVPNGAGSLTLLKADSGEVVWQEAAPAGYLRPAVFSPDGRLVAAARRSADRSGAEVVVLDAVTGESRRRLRCDGYWVMGLAFHPGGRLAVADRSGITLWDPASGRQVLALPVSEPIEGLAFDPNGHWLACGTADGGVMLYDGRPP